MTIIERHFVACNWCGREDAIKIVYSDAPEIETMIEAVYPKDWWCAQKGSNSEDYCPKCVTEMTEEKRAKANLKGSSDGKEEEISKAQSQACR